MNGSLIFVACLVVGAIILAFVVHRSLKGPKVAPVNPFDAVQPSRAPQFPDKVGEPAAAVAAHSHHSTAESDSGVQQEEDAEQEKDMTIAAYVAQAQEQEKEADFDQAIDSIGEAIGLAQVEFGGDSVEVARLLIKQGQLYQLRDYEEVEGINCIEYLQGLAILQQRFGGNSEELLPVLKLLISWYYQTGDLQKADTLIRRCDTISEAVSRAKSFAESGADEGSTAAAALTPASAPAMKISPFKVPFTSSDSAAVESCKEGDEAFAAAEYDDAVAAFEAAIESVQIEVGRSAPELVQLFHRLGRVLQVKDAGDTDDEGNAYTDPADNMQIALSMLVKIHGFDAVELVPLLLDLAAFEDQRGDHYKAETYLRRLDMLERMARNAANARKAKQ